MFERFEAQAAKNSIILSPRYIQCPKIGANSISEIVEAGHWSMAGPPKRFGTSVLAL